MKYCSLIGPVRIEIGEALARDIPVVPVLIDGAPLPDVGLLPDDLKELVDRQAEFVEYRIFEADVERLIKKLRLDQGVDRTNSLRQSMPARRLKAEAKQRADEEERRRKAEVEERRRDEEERRRQEAEDRRRLDEAEAEKRRRDEERRRQARAQGGDRASQAQIAGEAET